MIYFYNITLYITIILCKQWDLISFYSTLCW